MTGCLYLWKKKVFWLQSVQFKISCGRFFLECFLLDFISKDGPLFSIQLLKDYYTFVGLRQQILNRAYVQGSRGQSDYITGCPLPGRCWCWILKDSCFRRRESPMNPCYTGLHCVCVCVCVCLCSYMSIFVGTCVIVRSCEDMPAEGSDLLFRLCHGGSSQR